jgi:hypothetical protein
MDTLIFCTSNTSSPVVTATAAEGVVVVAAAEEEEEAAAGARVLRWTSPMPARAIERRQLEA